MNEIVTLLIPLLGIVLLSRIFQYICNANKCDKIISLTVITVLQLCATIYLVSYFNDMGFNLFLFLSIIIIVLTNALHIGFDTEELNIRMSKVASMLVTFLIQALLLTGLYFIVL